MHPAKAMSAVTLALVLAAAPISAYAAPQRITIMPGDAINTDYVVATGTCTAAAPARDSRGNRYLLTAGHCVTGKVGEFFGQPIYYRNKLIGHIADARFMIVDYAAIKLLPNVTIGRNDVPHHAYLGKVNSGSRVCFHGTRSGVRCGTFDYPKEIAFMRGAILPSVVIGSSVNVVSRSGDSGAAVYTSKGIVGVLSGGGEGSMLYTPIQSIYDHVRTAIPGFRIAD